MAKNAKVGDACLPIKRRRKDPKSTWRDSRQLDGSVDSVEAAMGTEKCADTCGKLPSVFETLVDYP